MTTALTDLPAQRLERVMLVGHSADYRKDPRRMKALLDRCMRCRLTLIELGLLKRRLCRLLRLNSWLRTWVWTPFGGQAEPPGER